MNSNVGATHKEKNIYLWLTKFTNRNKKPEKTFCGTESRSLRTPSTDTTKHIATMNHPIRFTTPEEAVKVIKSGDHVHLSSVASVPQILVRAMTARGEAGELQHVHIHHLHSEGEALYAVPEMEGIFQLDSFFVGGNVRKVTQSGYADYIPIFLSETQKLYRSGTVPCDVAMIQVSTPDKHGYVSLGTSVDATLAAVETARTVIAVVNKHVPRSFGDAMIHSSKIDLFVQDDTPLKRHISPNPTRSKPASASTARP